MPDIGNQCRAGCRVCPTPCGTGTALELSVSRSLLDTAELTGYLAMVWKTVSRSPGGSTLPAVVTWQPKRESLEHTARDPSIRHPPDRLGTAAGGVGHCGHGPGHPPSPGHPARARGHSGGAREIRCILRLQLAAPQREGSGSRHDPDPAHRRRPPGRRSDRHPGRRPGGLLRQLRGGFGPGPDAARIAGHPPQRGAPLRGPRVPHRRAEQVSQGSPGAGAHQNPAQRVRLGRETRVLPGTRRRAGHRRHHDRRGPSSRCRPRQGVRPPGHH